MGRSSVDMYRSRFSRILFDSKSIFIFSLQCLSSISNRIRFCWWLFICCWSNIRFSFRIFDNKIFRQIKITTFPNGINIILDSSNDIDDIHFMDKIRPKETKILKAPKIISRRFRLEYNKLKLIRQFNITKMKMK